MRWTWAAGATKWGLAVAAAGVAVLCPLTRWLKGQWLGPAAGPSFAVIMAGETIVVNTFASGLPAGVAPSQLWWSGGPVQWNFWFHYRSTPGTVQIVMPMWPLAMAPGLGALLLWRAEVQSRRRRLGLCPSCGYERAGLPSDAKCPECGAVVTK